LSPNEPLINSFEKWGSRTFSSSRAKGCQTRTHFVHVYFRKKNCGLYVSDWSKSLTSANVWCSYLC
jgi:hypothetical protein